MERWPSVGLETGARADRQTRRRKVRRRGGQTEPRAHGQTDGQAGWGAPRAGAYRQVQAEGAEYIAGRGGGGGS